MGAPGNQAMDFSLVEVIGHVSLSSLRTAK
jgi:hypothetical protein